MIRIEQDLTYFPKIYQRNLKSSYYMPYIEGIVINPHNQKKTYSTHKFIVDTGAAISILNSSFGFLFKDNDTPVIDCVNIQYGGNSQPNLPVYSIKLKIKGVEFDLPAVYDKNMTITSLLGHFEFLNTLEHLSISKKRRKLTLIK